MKNLTYLKQTLYLITIILALFFLNACKPDAYPENPDYTIIKPKVKYPPSKESLTKMVKDLQGHPYVWAEEGPNNFDCSGFTYYLYGSMGIEIPRVAREQAKTGKRIQVKELQYGDLIFFATNRHNRNKITHVGMYLGEGWFTHASTVKEEVIYSNLFTSTYYKKRLRVCRRYLPEPPLSSKKEETPWRAEIKEETLAKERRDKAKAIVIQAPIKDFETPSKNGNFFVQVGSFSGKPKKSLITKITHLGFREKIIHFSLHGKEISKLLIGPYIKKEQAHKVLPFIRKNIQKDAFIAEIR